MFVEYGYEKNLAENINISDIPDEPYVFDIVSPNKPSKPSGPVNRNLGKEYTYSSITTDPNNEQLYYKWDWGAGTFSDLLGPYSSGETCSESHTRDKKGDYETRVIAKNSYDFESDWSYPLSITISKNKPINLNILFQKFLERHLDLFLVWRPFIELYV